MNRRLYEARQDLLEARKEYVRAVKIYESTGGTSMKGTSRKMDEEDLPEYGANDNLPYEKWINFLHGKMPAFEFNDGIVYVDYDENSGCLLSGGVTNAGFYKDGDAEVKVEDGNFQSALEEIYDQLSSIHSEDAVLESDGDDYPLPDDEEEEAEVRRRGGRNEISAPNKGEDYWKLHDDMRRKTYDMEDNDSGIEDKYLHTPKSRMKDEFPYEYTKKDAHRTGNGVYINKDDSLYNGAERIRNHRMERELGNVHGKNDEMVRELNDENFNDPISMHEVDKDWGEPYLRADSYVQGEIERIFGDTLQQTERQKAGVYPQDQELNDDMGNDPSAWKNGYCIGRFSNGRSEGKLGYRDGKFFISYDRGASRKEWGLK